MRAILQLRERSKRRGWLVPHYDLTDFVSQVHEVAANPEGGATERPPHDEFTFEYPVHRDRVVVLAKREAPHRWSLLAYTVQRGMVWIVYPAVTVTFDVHKADVEYSQPDVTEFAITSPIAVEGVYPDSSLQLGQRVAAYFLAICSLLNQPQVEEAPSRWTRLLRVAASFLA